MKSQDEELQRLAEAGELRGNNPDSKAYIKVFDALSTEPSFTLPSSFAQNVIQKLAALEAKRETRRDVLWLIAGIVTFGIATIVCIVLTGFKFNSGAFTFLKNYGGLVFFGLALAILFQVLEKKLLPNVKRQSLI